MKTISRPIVPKKSMPIDPEELLPRKKTTEIELGQDLSAFSENELTARNAAPHYRIESFKLVDNPNSPTASR